MPQTIAVSKDASWFGVAVAVERHLKTAPDPGDGVQCEAVAPIFRAMAFVRTVANEARVPHREGDQCRRAIRCDRAPRAGTDMSAATGTTRSESVAFGAWRCRVMRADGTLRMDVLYRKRPWDEGCAACLARNWRDAMLGKFDGKRRLDDGDTASLQFRAPGKSRFVSVSA